MHSITVLTNNFKPFDCIESEDSADEHYCLSEEAREVGNFLVRQVTCEVENPPEDENSTSICRHEQATSREELPIFICGSDVHANAIEDLSKST